MRNQVVFRISDTVYIQTYVFMDSNFVQYIALLLMIIIGFVVVKRMAGCLLRTVVTIAMVAVLAFLYYKYFRV